MKTLVRSSMIVAAIDRTLRSRFAGSEQKKSLWPTASQALDNMIQS
jgi:hypothetical protein